MALWQLGLLVAGGISLIVYLVHASGGSRAATLTSVDDALARYAFDYPDDHPNDVLLSENRQSALLNIGTNAVGLICSIGDSFLTRRLQPGDIAAVSSVGNTVSLRLTDFTWRGGSLRFSEQNSASKAVTWLKQAGVHHA